MLYRIKNKDGKFSKGGTLPAHSIWGSKTGGKVWTTKGAFAGHLAILLTDVDRFAEEPASLFKYYGDAFVVEIDDTSIKEIPFKEWYANYYNTADKFSKVRGAAKKAKAQQSELEWSANEQRSVSRVIDFSKRMLSGIEAHGIIKNEKIGHYYAVTIDGVTYAICKLK